MNKKNEVKKIKNRRFKLLTFFFCTPLFVVLLFFSCKSRRIAEPLEHPKPEVLIEKEPEDPFLGLYVMDLPASRNGTSRNGITSYSVEFKADQTARVLLFKEGRMEPEISHGKWLIAKDGIIILYFEQNFLSEFFIKNDDGSLSFLNAQRKPYSGELAELLILRKIEKK
ncbi:hypothetical protein E4N87_11320 [Treponema denticola]|uniref:Lipoprotein n=1 Tax=Treponema denticola TaxID=158 RepID=A0A9Q9BE96_TREDN|nr:hypothetical protein [Treponema denticola]UTC91241.1 hypothetical protein E4N87_11320 [Treponema denticola]UTC99406.1 hypothetical protein E4N86_01255 [Treponema denticola]